MTTPTAPPPVDPPHLAPSLPTDDAEDDDGWATAHTGATSSTAATNVQPEKLISPGGTDDHNQEESVVEWDENTVEWEYYEDDTYMDDGTGGEVGAAGTGTVGETHDDTVYDELLQGGVKITHPQGTPAPSTTEGTRTGAADASRETEEASASRQQLHHSVPAKPAPLPSLPSIPAPLARSLPQHHPTGVQPYPGVSPHRVLVPPGGPVQPRYPPPHHQMQPGVPLQGPPQIHPGGPGGGAPKIHINPKFAAMQKQQQQGPRFRPYPTGTHPAQPPPHHPGYGPDFGGYPPRPMMGPMHHGYYPHPHHPATASRPTATLFTVPNATSTGATIWTAINKQSSAYPIGQRFVRALTT
ncbi:hypothetical protein HKX48_008457 [Thoreauomyces humboldtii]|nr:hypothetical protein HKX48_008457 [Thoreauomyces humboldtii]